MLLKNLIVSTVSRFRFLLHVEQQWKSDMTSLPKDDKHEKQ